MKSLRKAVSIYLGLTKPGIALFSIVAALIGFAVSFPIGQPLEMWRVWLLVIGVYLTSSGAFAINQAQEAHLDARMERTKSRPIARGDVSRWQGFVLGLLLLSMGLLALLLVSSWAAAIGALIVVLYNGLYTLWWKQSSPYGVIPGAIPGALPITLGYAANSSNLLSAESLYLFLVLFLWQMPHFWCLAIRYREDYRAGGIPVMPVALGVPKTLYFVGVYTATYVAVALVAPWFVESRWAFVFLILPMSAVLLWELKRYLNAPTQGPTLAWLRFFLWTNLSVIVFAAAPALERWARFIYFVHLGV